MLRLPPILGRDFLLWCALPCAGAIMMVSLFALPNYLRADKLRNDAQLLRAVTDETIIAQENLRKLTTVVTQLGVSLINFARSEIFLSLEIFFESRTPA